MTVWVFHARLYHSFLEHGNFWYQILSQVSVPHTQGVVGFLKITLLQIFHRIDRQKIFKNRLRFDRVWCLPFIRNAVYIQGEVTSQSLWSRYDCHFVGITRYNALSSMAKIYRVIQIKLNQLV